MARAKLNRTKEEKLAIKRAWYARKKAGIPFVPKGKKTNRCYGLDEKVYSKYYAKARGLIKLNCGQEIKAPKIDKESIDLIIEHDNTKFKLSKEARRLDSKIRMRRSKTTHYNENTTKKGCRERYTGLLEASESRQWQFKASEMSPKFIRLVDNYTNESYEVGVSESLAQMENMYFESENHAMASFVMRVKFAASRDRYKTTNTKLLHESDTIVEEKDVGIFNLIESDERADKNSDIISMRDCIKAYLELDELSAEQKRDLQNYINNDEEDLPISIFSSVKTTLNFKRFCQDFFNCKHLREVISE